MPIPKPTWAWAADHGRAARMRAAAIPFTARMASPPCSVARNRPADSRNRRRDQARNEKRPAFAGRPFAEVGEAALTASPPLPTAGGRRTSRRESCPPRPRFRRARTRRRTRFGTSRSGIFPSRWPDPAPGPTRRARRSTALDDRPGRLSRSSCRRPHVSGRTGRHRVHRRACRWPPPRPGISDRPVLPTISRPAPTNAAKFTLSVGPSKRRTSFPVPRSQSRMVPSGP